MGEHSVGVIVIAGADGLGRGDNVVGAVALAATTLFSGDSGTATATATGSPPLASMSKYMASPLGFAALLLFLVPPLPNKPI